MLLTYLSTLLNLSTVLNLSDIKFHQLYFYFGLKFKRMGKVVIDFDLI